MPLFLPPKRPKDIYDLVDELCEKIREINKLGYDVTIPHYDVKHGQHQLSVGRFDVRIRRKPGTTIPNANHSK